MPIDVIPNLASLAALVAASDVVFDLIGDLLEVDVPNANLFYVVGRVVRQFASEFFANVTARGEEVKSG